MLFFFNTWYVLSVYSSKYARIALLISDSFSLIASSAVLVISKVKGRISLKNLKLVPTF